MAPQFVALATSLSPPTHLKIALLSGRGGGFPPKSPIEGDKKVHLFMGMTPRLKTMPNVPLGFPEYGMANASTFRWGIPPTSNPTQKGAKRGAFIFGNDTDAKNSVKSFLMAPRVRNDQCQQLFLLAASNPQRLRKGHSFME